MDQIEQTATQKARQLVERYYFALPNNGSQTGINNVHSRWAEAKMCAQITAAEVVAAMTQLWGGTKEAAYWQQVQEEISKL